MRVGTRIELTSDVDALGHAAHAGDRGVVTGVHADDYLSARMDDGRTQFPRSDEVQEAASGAAG